jgi:electron transfer flavoprotein alpha subunit
MSALVIAEHDHAGLKRATLHSVSAALALGGPVDLLVAGHSAAAIAEAARKIAGVTKVLHADDAAYGHGLVENLAPLIIGLAGPYSHLLATATTFGKNLMPRVAALLDVAQVSEILQIISPDTFVRPTYAGNALVTLQCTDAKKVLTVRATAFEPAATSGGEATLEVVKGPGEQGKSRYLKSELSDSGRPELTSARIIVSGGRGMQSGNNFKLIEAVADRLGAAIGASRAAVDAGFVSNDYQVGQTGKVVAPDLYIAVGISGAIQHLAGMKDSKVIAAINKDAEAPIFQIADYGLVADLFKALPELAAELDRQGISKK